MRKQLLIVFVLLVLIPPLSSFAPAKKTTPLRHKELKQTNWSVGYFDQNGHTYEVIGDNFGGSSGNIVSVLENGVALPLGTGTWDTGLANNYVKYRYQGGSVTIYEGLFYVL